MMHEPVMVAEVLAAFDLQPGQVVVDGTVGLGGHSWAILGPMQGKGVLVGIDRDPVVLAEAKVRLQGARVGGVRLELVVGRYDLVDRILPELGLVNADAILLDLGFNSAQTADPARGLAFSVNGPLDGRYNPAEPGTRSVGEIVNTAGESELAQLLWELADERHSRRIAKAIVAARESAPIETTFQLAEIIRAAVPARERHGRIDAATKSFQALRMAANSEKQIVERGVRACAMALSPGGTLCVLAYHSGEDTITKRVMDDLGSPWPDPTNPFAATSRAGLEFRVEKRGAILPSAEEIARNPRSRSARLRILRRLTTKATEARP